MPWRDHERLCIDCHRVDNLHAAVHRTRATVRDRRRRHAEQGHRRRQVTGARPTSLPTQIPTTMEGITREEIERRINATDSEDALKYLPSLLVRKRYIGDYNHAILSSRASGTGNSARSAVYADGILLSNYLGNGVGGLSLPAALGPGDARGDRARRRDVRPVLGRLPRQLGRRGGRLRDAHADAASRPTPSSATSSQPFELYNTHDDLPRLAGQRLAGRPRRRLVLVDQRQPHRQRGPAADLRHPPGRARAPPGTRRHAGDRRRARPNNANQPWYRARRRHAVPHACRTT